MLKLQNYQFVFSEMTDEGKNKQKKNHFLKYEKVDKKDFYSPEKIASGICKLALADCLINTPNEIFCSTHVKQKKKGKKKKKNYIYIIYINIKKIIKKALK